MAGVIIASSERIQELIVKESELLGASISPCTSWLVIRSLRTLTMRMERYQGNAFKVATFLESHPQIRRVRWPGLNSHPPVRAGMQANDGFHGPNGIRTGN